MKNYYKITNHRVYHDDKCNKVIGKAIVLVSEVDSEDNYHTYSYEFVCCGAVLFTQISPNHWDKIEGNLANVLYDLD